MDACAYYKEDAGKLLLGRLRAQGQALGHGRHPARISPSTSCPRISIISQPILEGAIHRVPSPRESRHPQVLQRAGELHRRPALHPRPGAGTRRTSSSPPVSTRSASSPAAAPAWALAHWIAERRAALRSLGRRYPPADRRIMSAQVASWCRGSPRRWDCSTRCTGRTGSSSPRVSIRLTPFYARIGRRRAPASARSPAGSGRTGMRRKVSCRSTATLMVRQNWFDYCGAGVPQHPRARRPARSKLDLRQVPGGGSRMPSAELQRICHCANVSRPWAAPHYTQWLNAEGRDRGRSHRHQARGEPVHGGDRRRDRRLANWHYHQDARSRAGAKVDARIEDASNDSMRRSGIDGTEEPRACCSKLTRRRHLSNAALPVRRRQVRSMVGPDQGAGAAASPMSASSAGSSIIPSGVCARGVLEAGARKRAMSSVLSPPACMPWTSMRIEKAYPPLGPRYRDPMTRITGSRLGASLCAISDKATPFLGREAVAIEKQRARERH